MILMYHHVAPLEAVPVAADESEGWEFTLSPQGFERQLTALRQRGYRFVSLNSMADDIRKRGVEDARAVAVTFDDGWVDNFWFARPVLKQLSITATFFVTSAQLRNGTRDGKRMGCDQLKQLLDDGMGIGGHSRTHPNLTELPLAQAREEIAGCKEDLERALGSPVSFFAYPGGAFNRDVARLTQEAGFTGACSVIGPSRNDTSTLFWLHRDILSESMRTWHDRYRLSPWARRLFSFRVHRRLRRQLVHGT
jgi:peptidoglycan/xylan/chitin deacetylase (PgdA/CDA1 family)